MMTDQESAFVEEMGQVLASYGMTPMAGRMWGWLLICDPPEQTAADIADALHASRGAISGTARILRARASSGARRVAATGASTSRRRPRRSSSSWAAPAGSTASSAS